MGPSLQHAPVILHLSLRLHYERGNWPASLSRFTAMVLPSFSTALYSAPGSLSPTSPLVPTSNPPVQTAACGKKTQACFCRSEAVKKWEAKRVCLCSTSIKWNRSSATQMKAIEISEVQNVDWDWKRGGGIPEIGGLLFDQIENERHSLSTRPTSATKAWRPSELPLPSRLRAKEDELKGKGQGKGHPAKWKGDKDKDAH
ncbi:hypothetical protein D8674_014660 [Pyrus ussuriensis x Pyrus communis]|uniref:Uncharacterized protein n=1 Tax=Pyrus ussuriensis x Pyrus communis TaxID=2448454 RepID=A0A5N5GY31_9ROSA|nr:hypothetical protein D8674_014660 [Pyrus ussuriensis x Pyrus communis]